MATMAINLMATAKKKGATVGEKTRQFRLSFLTPRKSKQIKSKAVKTASNFQNSMGITHKRKPVFKTKQMTRQHKNHKASKILSTRKLK